MPPTLLVEPGAFDCFLYCVNIAAKGPSRVAIHIRGAEECRWEQPANSEPMTIANAADARMSQSRFRIAAATAKISFIS